MENHQHISAAAVRRLCGDISDMTLYRLANDPTSTFPKPIYIGRFRFWREVDVVAWLNSRPTTRPRSRSAA